MDVPKTYVNCNVTVFKFQFVQKRMLYLLRGGGVEAKVKASSTRKAHKLSVYGSVVRQLMDQRRWGGARMLGVLCINVLFL